MSYLIKIFISSPILGLVQRLETSSKESVDSIFSLRNPFLLFLIGPLSGGENKINV